MRERIPLHIVEGRLVLTSVIECPSLRIRKQLMEFVIDTGSPDSYLSDRDVRRLQVPLKGGKIKGEVDFGGSRFKQIKLPKITMYLLKEDPEKGYYTLRITLSALRTTKCSQRKLRVAQTLPSILGLDFLKEQRVSLHVLMSENMAYLEFED